MEVINYGKLVFAYDAVFSAVAIVVSDGFMHWDAAAHGTRYDR